MKLNETMIIGNLGRDPQETQLPSGTVGSVFPVGVNNDWTDRNGERHTQTTWFTVRVSNNQASACNSYLYKGRKVLVRGRLRADDYGNPRIWFKNDDTNRENPRTTFELLAYNVEFGEDTRRNEAPAHAEYEKYHSTENSEVAQEDSDNDDAFPF